MIQIRESQICALATDCRTRFADRVTTFLQQHFPDAAKLPRNELHCGVVKQLANAGAYGLESEQQQATYAAAAWLLGEDFDARIPAVKAVLDSHETSGEYKSRWLADFAQQMFAILERA
jgi:hypothetical protein